MVIADTSGPLSDFRPYVPSINDRGVVAFQATRQSGATGVFCGDGGPLSLLPQPAIYRSHPDINNHGALCAYAELPAGQQVVVIAAAGKRPEIVSREAHPTIGPLGPTMNDAGVIAFRASSRAGRPGIYVVDAMSFVAIAEAGERFRGFEGLPVIIDDHTVFFRADHVDGGHGIYARRQEGPLACIVATGDRFAELGRFPSANAGGSVVFTGTQRDGTSGIFRAAGGRVETLIDIRAGFESFRGALTDDAGRIVFYATPPGGTLGIYAFNAAGPRRLVGLGEEFFNSPLTELALNPVSINNAGQIALRLMLADRRQLIVRLDAFA